MVGLGLGADFLQEEVVEVWPECHQAFTLFCKVEGQWRAGMGGPYALDYGPLFVLMERMHLSDDQFDELFTDIRAMEAAAIEAMRSDEK